MSISVLGISYSLFSLNKINDQYQTSSQTYRELSGVYYNESEKGDENLFNRNSDYVGWLNMDDTVIDYPVVQGEDNDFYLTRDFHQEEDRAGAIFMDYRNRPERMVQNIIIYGHNMKDGSMFGMLKNYLDQDFFEQHQMMTFSDLDSTYDWEIFSVYKSTEIDWMQTSFDELDDYDDFLMKVRGKSQVHSEVEVDRDDVILTLATCTSSDEERFVVHARLVKEGEA